MAVPWPCLTRPGTHRWQGPTVKSDIVIELNLETLWSLEHLIREVAETELISRFHHVQREYKADGSMVTEADRASQARIQAELNRLWPAIPLLGEEMSQEEQRQVCHTNHVFWCLDPLDGTTNYAAGIPYFAISLALLENNVVSMGIVCDPIRKEVFSAIRGKGAYLNGNLIEQPKLALSLEQAIGLIDFKRLPAGLATALANSPPYSSQRSFGAGALDWCQIAMGRCHVYLHGKQRLWDYAAGRLILEEAGGQWCSLDIAPGDVGLLYPRGYAAATDKRLFDLWRAWVDTSV